jgi:hypothetical protein
MIVVKFSVKLRRDSEYLLLERIHNGDTRRQFSVEMQALVKINNFFSKGFHMASSKGTKPGKLNQGHVVHPVIYIREKNGPGTHTQSDMVLNLCTLV